MKRNISYFHGKKGRQSTFYSIYVDTVYKKEKITVEEKLEMERGGGGWNRDIKDTLSSLSSQIKFSPP